MRYMECGVGWCWMKHWATCTRGGSHLNSTTHYWAMYPCSVLDWCITRRQINVSHTAEEEAWQGIWAGKPNPDLSPCHLLHEEGSFSFKEFHLFIRPKGSPAGISLDQTVSIVSYRVKSSKYWRWQNVWKESYCLQKNINTHMMQLISWDSYASHQNLVGVRIDHLILDEAPDFLWRVVTEL